MPCLSPKLYPACIFNYFLRPPAARSDDAILRLQRSQSPVRTPVVASLSAPAWREGNNSRPHTVRFNGVWDLPVGKGRQFLSKSKLANIFLGGWRTGAIYNFRSGSALDLGNWFFYGSDLRSMVNSGDNQTNDAWFNWKLLPGASRDYTSANRSAYEARIRQIVPQSVLTEMGNICGPLNNQTCTYANVTPTNFQPNNFHVRVFPQRLNFLRRPIANQIDLNIARIISVTEKLKMSFRADFINALNHVNWQGPNTDINSSKITQADQRPRQLPSAPFADYNPSISTHDSSATRPSARGSMRMFRPSKTRNLGWSPG